MFVQDGKTINYTNGGAAAIAYGDVIPLVTRIGIAGENVAVGETGSVHVKGVFEIDAINTAAFAVGDQLYYDAVAKKLTNVAAGNTPAGWCVYPKAETGISAFVCIG